MLVLMSWGTRDDIDLHVIDPVGREFFYQRKFLSRQPVPSWKRIIPAVPAMKSGCTRPPRLAPTGCTTTIFPVRFQRGCVYVERCPDAGRPYPTTEQRASEQEGDKPQVATITVDSGRQRPHFNEVSTMEYINALRAGTRLGGIRRSTTYSVKAAFGITYLAEDIESGQTSWRSRNTCRATLPHAPASSTVVPNSSADATDYRWGLDRFLDEARTLARFDHPHLNKVHRFLRGQRYGLPGAGVC